MKRKAENLDASSTKTSNDVETDNKKKKKVRFEKSLDKPTGKNIKTPTAKKNSQKNGLKLAKNNATIEKINQLKLKKKKEVGQKSDAKKTKSSKESNKELAKNNATAEKTDWLKLKKERKELREKRRAKKVNNATIYDKINEAKKISETLRRSDCSLNDRVKLTQTLHEMLKTHYSKVIFTHDISRVVQCMIKYSEADVRQAIICELKPFITQMLESKYAKNCIRAILKRGTREMRNDIISAFYGNIVRLMSHTVSAPLVELTYSTWCTDLDKIYFKQEFFGDLYKLSKDKSVKSLSDVFETAPDMKTATLSAVKTNLVRILNKLESVKNVSNINLINSTLLHTVIWEYFCVCSVENRNELIVMLRNFIVNLSMTKMGAKVAAQCIWHGNNKDRKVIVKSFKENVKAVCTSEHGYMTLLALFDSVDDTVMLKKIILSELQQDLVDIALNEYGKHVILYLVARRDSRYFPPSVVEHLRKGDNNSISKKPADIREKELLETIQDPLLDAIIADAATWLSNGAIAMVTLAILKVARGEKLRSAFESVAKFISNIDSKIKENDIECNLVEHPGLHMMLKKLIQNDKELLERNECTFGEILISHLTAEVLQKWIDFNRACFLLIFLIENESKSNVHELLSKLKPLAKSLKSKNSPGSSILLKKF